MIMRPCSSPGPYPPDASARRSKCIPAPRSPVLASVARPRLLDRSLPNPPVPHSSIWKLRSTAGASLHPSWPSAGAELDLLVLSGGKRYGFECKFADVPGTTRSMRVALQDLGLDHLWIVYPGDEEYALDDRISVLPVTEIGTVVEGIGSKGW